MSFLNYLPQRHITEFKVNLPCKSVQRFEFGRYSDIYIQNAGMLIVSVDRLTKKCYSVLSSALPEPKMRSVNRFLPCGSVQEGIFHEISPSSKYFRQMVSLPVRRNLAEVLFNLDTGLALSKSDLKSQKNSSFDCSRSSVQNRGFVFPTFEFKFPD